MNLVRKQTIVLCKLHMAIDRLVTLQHVIRKFNHCNLTILPAISSLAGLFHFKCTVTLSDIGTNIHAGKTITGA